MFVLFSFLALVAACMTLAAPTTSTSQPQPPSNPTKSATETRFSSLFTQDNDPVNTVLVTYLLSNASILLSNPTDPRPSQSTQSNSASGTASSSPLPVSLISFIIPPSLAASSTPPPPTILVTEVATIFETTTVDTTPSPTVNVTVVVTATATASSTATAPPSFSWDNCTLWAAPPQMTDLSAFNVTHFPSGQRNLHMVAQVPAEAIAPTAKSLQSPLDADANNTSTILQLVYPAHSANPGSKPVGGADFYATPLNLSGARNVTLDYRVFFPADFDWVKGGKLPGLFGGHTGCSGGASARDCFSTRMMWRSEGAGELYLYAPKDKQTDALCADAGSVCDVAYGFSIGRGTFNFTAGDWTHLRQNVVLNTPGQNDGMFMLFVDGRPTINRTDMFYRDAGPHMTAEFIGLFFSTFFGGHGKKYATPKQQYTWFKDFAITRHD